MLRRKLRITRDVSFAMLVLVAILPFAATAAEPDPSPDVVVFYRNGCEDCRHMDEVLAELQKLYPTLSVRHIEESEDSAGWMWSLSTAYGVFPSAFPVIFVGDEVIVGIGRDKELLLRRAVSDCASHGCASPLERIREAQPPWRLIIVGGLVVAGFILVMLLTR